MAHAVSRKPNCMILDCVYIVLYLHSLSSNLDGLERKRCQTTLPLCVSGIYIYEKQKKRKQETPPPHFVIPS
jgi:hypothetical protein